NAFLDPDAMAKWMPPNGYTAHVYKFEPKVGGLYRMSFSSLDKKDTHFFGGKYLEIKPYERLHYTDKFESDDPLMQGEIKVTVTSRNVTVTLISPCISGIKVTVTFRDVPGG